MAEFKLGRIKFVWKNAWTTGTTYYVDDVIRFGGKTFICVVGHTAAADFYTDANNVPARWNRFADGQSWLGEWAPSTGYKINDIVKYGGITYICNLAHTSTALLETDQSSWTVFAEGFDWQSDWVISYIYKVNDIVKYGGNVYLCNTAHTSAETDTLGLEDNLSDWDVFTEGLDWKNTWDVEVRYKVNDVVKYGGQVYVCNTPHTSAVTPDLGLEVDQSNWDFFNKGTEFLGDWAISTRYKVNDLVKYGSSIWRCVDNHTATTEFDTVKFEIFVPGISFQDVWNSSIVYTPGDIVRYGGWSYVAKTVHSNQTPENNANWELISTGYSFRGEWSDNNSYLVGEVVTHGGYTYAATANNVAQDPASQTTWTRLNSGLRWRGRWNNSISYLLGDIIRFKSFSYVCVQPHISDDDDSTITPTINSPEKDVSGTFWNLITAGLEESILSNPGDLVYYSPQGIAALPIGGEGQVLIVEDGLPAWKFWGLSDKVYYVGLHGVDEAAPLYGVTLDKPFRTVKYATEQIENGAEFPNAGYLLKKNRTFFQKETVEYAIWSGFSLPVESLQADLGLLFDAAVHDLTHGGNVRSIRIARSYFTPLGQSSILGQEAQTVAAINYGLSLIELILGNLQPQQNYQEINGILINDRIKQIVDFGVVAENSSTALTSSLVGITTNAITNNTLDELPKEVVPGYTINIKTGLFEEILPIIVPANVAIVGDELRSTKVSPAAKLIATNDKAKSVATVNYLKSITEDVVTNTVISKTTGNTATQITTAQRAGNIGSAAAVTRVVSNSAVIKNVLETNLVPAVLLTNPTGWGSSLVDTAYATTVNNSGATTGYDDGRSQIQANKNFIVAETTAWIQEQIDGNIAPFTSSFTYNSASCANDVALIVDAIVYDVTYGGNTQTIIAGEAYYSYGVATFGNGEKSQTLAAYAHLQSIISDVVLEVAITPSVGNVLTQNTAGEPGSAASAEFASERVQDIIDVITVDGNQNNIGYPTRVEPAVSWVLDELVTAYEELIAQTAIIQSDSVQYIKREYPTLLFNEDTCSRDVGFIVDALGYDLMFNSNFASITAGRAYRRGTASAQLVVAQQLDATKDIIDFISKKSSYIVATGAAVTADLLWTDIASYIDTGISPIIVGTNIPTNNLDTINGATILQLNKEFLASEAVAWTAENFVTAVTASNTGTGGGVSQTFTITTVPNPEGAGRIYQVDGVNYPVLNLVRGGVYTFIQSDPTNSNHPIAFRDTFDNSFTQGVINTGTPGVAGAQTVFTVPNDAPDDLRYYCTVHGNGMGNTITVTGSGIPQTFVVTVAQNAQSPGNNVFVIDGVQYPDLQFVIGSTYTFNQNDNSNITHPLNFSSTQNGTHAGGASFENNVRYYLDNTLVADATAYNSGFTAATTRRVEITVTSDTPNPLYYYCYNHGGMSVNAEILISSYTINQTFTVTAVANPDGAGAIYQVEGVNKPQLTLFRGNVYTFDQSDASNVTHQIAFKDGAGDSYTVGVVTTGDVGTAGAQTVITVASDAPADLRYYCVTHGNGMGNTITVTDAGGEFTATDTSWMVVGDAVKFSGTVFGGINTESTYFVASIVNATTFTISATLLGAALPLTEATGTMTAAFAFDQTRYTDSVFSYIDAVTYDLVHTGNYKSTYAAGYYRNALTGSKLENMYLVRNGCGLRNQTTLGLDGSSDGNITGQQSPLTPPDSVGLSRPKAGAYASLDPGWGPNDDRVWIINKSTYVQNITTFGIGAIGQKIDGALHAQGNDSIVSNDFTQVISDGIGAWVTNLGRAELVSVFSYYAHIGYLAENGGKIRATNGNNSYGDFGSVADGLDLTEVPVTAKIDNQSNQAKIENVYTDGDRILKFEYSNAGLEYNTANYTINGPGSAASMLGNETRDGGVFQVRLTDPGDPELIGGEGYLTASNVAQAGNTTQITIAATDTALPGAYNGMAIYILSGTGVGQKGFIDTFNAASKIATVRKESTGEPGWDHIILGTAISASLDLTTIYEIVPRLTFSEPPYSTSLADGLESYSWKDIVFGDGFARYISRPALGGSGSNAFVDVTRRFGQYAITLVNGGFSYVSGDVLTVAGNLLGGNTPTNTLTITVNVVDSDTGEILSFSSTGTAVSAQWVAVAHNVNEVNTSVDGVTWTTRTLPTTAKWQAIAYGEVAGVSYYVAIAYESDDVAYSIDGINWSAASLGETWQWTDIAYGDGKFVVIAESDSSTTRRAISENGGETWNLGNVDSGAVAIAHGQGRFVLVEGFFSNVAAYSDNGFVWVNSTLPANFDSSTSNWQDIAYGSNRFVAIADNDAMVAVSVDRGETWVRAQLPVNAPWKKVTYGNGVFLAFAEGSIAASSADGIVWTIRDFTATDIDILSSDKDRIVPWTSTVGITADTWTAAAYGSDRYVTIAPGNDFDPAAGRYAYSADGTTWISLTLPLGSSNDVRDIAYGDNWFIVPQAGSQRIYYSQDGETFTYGTINTLGTTLDWSVIAYGNDRFVTIADQSIQSRFITSASLESNPLTSWTSGGTLSIGAEWTSMVYGADKFVVISGKDIDSDVVNYSTDATSWAATTMPSEDRWNSIAHGNGRFVVVAGNQTTATTKAAYSLDGITWVASTLPGDPANWISISFNGSVFAAVAYGSTRSLVSEDGITWREVALENASNWTVTVSDTDVFQTVTIGTGTTATELLEYEANRNLFTVDSTSKLAVGDIIEIVDDSSGRADQVFGGVDLGGQYFITSIFDATRFTVSEVSGGTNIVLTTGSGSMFAIVNKTWSAAGYSSESGFVVLSDLNPTAFKVKVGIKPKARPAILDNKIFQIWINEPGSNYDVENPPTMTIVDPNNIGTDAAHEVRVGSGVLAQPSFNNRGTGFAVASATVVGDGFADNYQAAPFVNFKDISDLPLAGANLQIAGIPDIFFKVVNVRFLRGVGPFSAEIQISPPIEIAQAPEHETAVTLRSRFSQVRLTGHDFLDIGTGNNEDTNYPGLPVNNPVPENETVLKDGGRVFFTSTDQDGNFRVGGLFNVEQSTGTATINADAFNLAGLNELSLGSVALGGGGAAITEFSTDPFFTADSDSVVPTQRAIKAFINSQIGGGSGSLNVNTITAGIIFIAGQSITTTTLQQININTKVNFTGGVDGYGIATSLFLQA